MYFRKKPVVIEAVQYTGDKIEIREFTNGGVYEDSGKQFALMIPTLEGHMEIRRDDWVIKGVAGEFYPCKPNIFEQTYEPVSNNTA